MTAKNNIKNVLVAPLDWGLGHATRCIPLIRALINAGFEVILAAENTQATLLKTEFPSLTCLALAGYRVKYSKQGGWLPLALLKQIPRLLLTIRKEHAWLKKMVVQYKIDLVIADNRYGLYHKKIPCIFITHQLLIKAPFAWLEKLIQQLNYRFINRFTACWVPDAKGKENAAGLLSHPPKLPNIPLHYLGIISRFEFDKAPLIYDYTLLLSGPEPQRTILENILINEFANISGKVMLVRGMPGGTEVLSIPHHIQVVNHLASAELEKLLHQSKLVICRSGYSSVMDLLCLQKRTLLIPTPGQTEQVYLAKLLAENNIFYSVNQNQLKLKDDLANANDFSFAITGIERFNPNNIISLINASL